MGFLAIIKVLKIYQVVKYSVDLLFCVINVYTYLYLKRHNNRSTSKLKLLTNLLYGRGI